MIHRLTSLFLIAVTSCLVLFGRAQDASPTEIAYAKENEEIIHLDRFSVTENRPESYSGAATDSSSKLAVPLLATPQNIQVIPRSLLDDQAVIKLDDALRNVAGVSTGGYYENWDYFRIRGFSADFNTYIDGLRGGNGMGEETFGLEQVEIVKGPASSLFGQGPVGGLVNLVSKRPRAEAFADLKFTYGNFNYRAATADINVPLGSPALLFRVPVLVNAQDSFIDVANKRSRFIAPTLVWNISKETEITVFTKYRETRIVHAMPLPAVGTVLPNRNGTIASDLYNGEPGSNTAYENSGQIGYEFVHKFNDALTLRQNARYDRFVQGWRNMLYPGYLSGDERILYRYPYNYWQDWHDLAVDTRLEAKFATAGIEHQVLVGVDQYRKSYSSRWQTIDFSDPSGYTGIDLFNPVYGARIPAYQPITASRNGTINTGYYLHDHIKLTDRFSATAGARYDVAYDAGHTVKDVTPRLGLVAEVREHSVVYFNYSESFSPQSTSMATAGGAPVDPERGTNWEVGYKQAAADGRLTATVALFQLTRLNVATADLTHPGFFTLSGEQRSRGIEFDGRFSPASGWELTTAYAYTDARITRDNTLPVGERTSGVPYHTVNAWTKYTFQSGALKGLGVGGGVRYYSAQVGDSTHTHYFELPPYAVVDLALYYAIGRLSAQVNVTNALDRSYYSGAYNDLYVLPGEPRSVRVTVGYRF